MGRQRGRTDLQRQTGGKIYRERKIFVESERQTDARRRKERQGEKD